MDLDAYRPRRRRGRGRSPEFPSIPGWAAPRRVWRARC